MKHKTTYLGFLILLLMATNLFSQTNFQVQGIVTDETNGDTLIGVTVRLKGSQKGTVTNDKGIFLLFISPGDYTLLFSYTGYESKEVPVNVNGNRHIAVTLAQALTKIDEVQVVSQRKFFGNIEYGREIPVINSKTIERLSVNNASDILHASVAGVWATKTSGSPGDHEKIRICGQNSFFSSAEPLYVVDGVPVPIVNMSSLGIADLNIHDIETVAVLKDASSSALYGFQGGNGVVLIDTKKGGESAINFSMKFGIQWFDNFYDQMNTPDFLTSLQLAKKNINSDLYKYYPSITDTPSYDNWQKEIIHTAYSKEYQLSASGTAGNTHYYVSGNYTDQQGILPNTNYNRYTISTRFSRILWYKLSLNVGYRGSMQNNKNNQDIYMGNPLLYEGISKSPCLRSTPDSLIYFITYGGDRSYYKRVYYLNPIYVTNIGPLNSSELPQSIIQNNKNNLDINSHIINSSARIKITDHISFNAMASIMLRYSDYYYNSYYKIVKSNEDVILFNHQYNIYYYSLFGKHKVDLVAAYRAYKDNLWWKVDTILGMSDKFFFLRNSMAAIGPNGSVTRSISSYVANASYNYNETYFISAVGNLCKIKEGFHTNYYTFFPSLAVSWDIARERPLKNITWLNSFNLYANWGKSGNYPLNGLSNELFIKKNYTYGSTTEMYPVILQLANHYLKHECTEEVDYGLKSSFLEKRLSVNAAYYIKSISNLILLRDIPEYYGGGKEYLNIGEIAIHGKELVIEATPLKFRDFSWSFKFNFSASDQTVKKLDNSQPLKFVDLSDETTPWFIIKEGRPLGDIYGYKVTGKWTDADTRAKDVRYVNYGGLKFLNADTIRKSLTTDDMVVIGNSIPKYTWDISNTFQYKDFSLNLLWYAVQGVKKYNATRAATIMTGTNREINNYLRDSIRAINSGAFYQSSLFIDDASFIRLKTITITYEPSKEFFNHLKFRFSLSFENMLTITKYKGYDPEATTFTDNNFSDNAIDRGAVPIPKAIYGGISVKF
jgi:TonB-dependent starch-binding outer membrane protein SusC